MNIRFKELQITNFKSHQDLEVKFGDLTKITGTNAVGKSTIPETLTWSLYGFDTFGSKLDPTPVGAFAGETRVDLLLEVDGKQVKFGRELKKGKTKYYVNDVPSKANEFSGYLDELFDKELFFSLFNPQYFFSLHWEKQRAMILQYVTAPSNKEVFKVLPKAQGDKLAELVKKHSLDDLNKIHRENKTRMEKQHIAAESRTKTLKDQLELLGKVEGDLEELEAEQQRLTEEIMEADKAPAEAFKKNQVYNTVKSELGMVQHQIDMSKERWPLLKNEPIEDTCRTCKQPLTEEAVKAVEVDKQKRMAEYKTAHKQLTDKKKSLQEQLEAIEFVDVTEAENKVRQLEAKRDPIADKIRAHKQREHLIHQIEQAEQDEKDKLTSLKESIFIIDAIKDFNAKEAELQAEKVQKLFKTLSIRLFKIQKNGDIKPDFEIEMDGKGYNKLSTAEKIKAGLELREVLSEQSELIAPTFVDNSESIVSFKQPSGQLIQIIVVADQELKIESTD